MPPSRPLCRGRGEGEQPEGPSELPFSLPSCWHLRVTHFSPFPTLFRSCTLQRWGRKEDTGKSSIRSLRFPPVFSSTPPPGRWNVAPGLCPGPPPAVTCLSPFLTPESQGPAASRFLPFLYNLFLLSDL